MDKLKSSDIFSTCFNNTLPTITRNTTVQPVVLMRLGVFVPKPSRFKNANSSLIDASNDLSKLEIAKAEGYDNITISGARLDMEVDFKVWIGIIHAFSKYGINSNTISLPYLEFAKLSGFSAERFGKRLKKDIAESLFRIRNKGIKFSKRSDAGRAYITGLLKSGELDFNSNLITLEADQKLWELYQFDHNVYLQLTAIKKLNRKETAQAIYTFIESLPPNPAPLSFTRLRERLLLKSTLGEQNRVIKNAIIELIKVGYLDANIIKKDNDYYLLINKRNAKLGLE